MLVFSTFLILLLRFIFLIFCKMSNIYDSMFLSSKKEYFFFRISCLISAINIKLLS